MNIHFLADWYLLVCPLNMKLQTATAKHPQAVASYLHRYESGTNLQSWPELVQHIMSCSVIPHPLSSMFCVLWSKNLSIRPLSHCFCPSGKALRWQPSKYTMSSPFSSFKQESTSSSSKPENSTPKKSVTSVFNSTTSTTTLHPTPRPATPLAPVVRPRRAHQEVLKPVVLVLPPVHFPNFFPPQHSRTNVSPSFNYNKWRTPAQTLPLSRSSGSLSKDAMVKSRPLFWAQKHHHKYKRIGVKCLAK